MSQREFSLMVDGYQDKKIDNYRQTRMLMFTMVRLWSSKGPKTPEQLWELPGDNPGMSDEEIKEITERFARLKDG